MELSSYIDIRGVRKKANRAAYVSRCQRNIVWRDKDMRIKEKVCIYKTCERIIQTYAIETRGDTAEYSRDDNIKSDDIKQVVKSP